MSLVAIVLGVVLTFLVLFDAFETIILPRTVNRTLRLTRLFYTVLWRSWGSLAVRIDTEHRRQYWLSIFGPMSLILLFSLWAYLIIFGFALLDWGLHSPLHTPENKIGFGAYLYSSGVTFFTLGYGDVTPMSALGRTVAMVEAGIGFGFLAIIVSYLPVIYQAFSKREVTPLLLDSRAGSPPAAGTLLHRYAQAGAMDELLPLLVRFENWCTDLLESFISYPVLATYRAQHEQLSWLAALTAILDTSAIILAALPNETHNQKHLRWQAQLTFAIARHVLVDLSYLQNVPPTTEIPERFTQATWRQFCQEMCQNCERFDQGEPAWNELQRLRGEYEPFLYGLSGFLFLAIPAWHVEQETRDSWQTSAWDKKELASHF